MSADPRIGTELGGYRIESLLGHGGMSVVYLAEHTRLKRKAALKLLSPELAEDPTFRARFVSEWERLAQLDHPNIIPVFEAGETNGLLFIAMRYVRTTDLKGLIASEGRLDPERAINIVAQTASALDAAHEQDLVHRDVKPANILIATGAGPEGGDHAYLCDFGLTKHTQSQSGLTQTGHFLGTIDYVAPEQISGKGVDGRTDQYALACVLYQCLTGGVPFPREEDTAALFAHLQDAPPRASTLRPDLPPALDDVIIRGMAKQKEERFESCTALARAARRTLGTTGSMTPVDAGPRAPAQTTLAAPPLRVAAPVAGVGVDLPTAPEHPPPWAPSPTPPAVREPGGTRRAIVIGAIVAGVVVLGLVAFTLLGGDEPGGPAAVTGAVPEIEPTVLLSEPFQDNSNMWETQPQNGITREIAENRYLFTITADALADAFAVSIGGTRTLSAADVEVTTVSTLVTRGGASLSNSFGVACRHTGDDAYFFLIGVSGRYSIQKLVDNGIPDELAAAPNARAIRPGRATNSIQAICIGGQDGTPVQLTLIVNGSVVRTVMDADAPILSGGAGIAVAGQPGLVVEFEDFEFAEFVDLGQASG